MGQASIGHAGPGVLPGLRMLNMSKPSRRLWLSLFLKLLAFGYVAAYVPWFVLILLKAPVLAPGGSLAPLFRFQPYNANYESMMLAIHLVWAVMLWRASANPPEHLLFIDFTIWANAAHGAVMVIVTPMQKEIFMVFVESLPLLGIAIVLWYLRPSGQPEVPVGAPLPNRAGP